jgi:hypothetical protein
MSERTTMGTPVITAGPLVTPTVRTGGQLVTGEFLMQGLEAFIWIPTPNQRGWLVVAFGIGVALVQNIIERRTGRRLVGTGTERR